MSRLPPLFWLPWPNHPDFTRPPTIPSDPAFELTYHRTQVNDDPSVFPDNNNPTDYPLPTQLLAPPHYPDPKPPTAFSAFLDDTPTDHQRRYQPFSTKTQRMTFPTPVHRRSRALASIYTAFFLSTLVRHHGLPSFSGLCFFCFSFFPRCAPFRRPKFPSPVNPKPGPSPIPLLRTTFPFLKAHL